MDDQRIEHRQAIRKRIQKAQTDEVLQTVVDGMITHQAQLQLTNDDLHRLSACAMGRVHQIIEATRLAYADLAELRQRRRDAA
jgi:hypothetical protein